MNVPEMRPLGTFSQFYQMIKMETTTVNKNFNFNFGYVFPSSMAVQSFITIKWQKKKFAMIKIFDFFPDHLNWSILLLRG